MTLIIQDERNNPDAAVFAGLGAVLKPDSKTDQAWEWGLRPILTGQGSVTRAIRFSERRSHPILRWDCVENCIQPEIQWIRRSRETYELTSF